MPQGHRQTGITNTQRVALRQHAAGSPHLTQNQLKAWFEAQFGRSITQPTVSASLSPTYDHLDNLNQDVEPSTQRRRPAQYPDLEEALRDWMQEMHGASPITEEAIRAQAAALFRNMPNYDGLRHPTFGRTWMRGFRRRQELDGGFERQSPTHGQEDPFHQSSLSMLASQWPLANIFNCDEASLLWKLLPYTEDFAHYPLLADAMEKLKLTAVLCSNATGEERLPIWFVGDEKELMSTDGGHDHVQDAALDYKWKHNESASMTSTIFAEWLIWFDEQTTGRRILLLLASRDVHVSAVEEISSGDKPLKNTTIAWLSFDGHESSSMLPIELDIVDLFKIYYARQWLTHVLAELEQRRDPVASLNLVAARRWSFESWGQIQASSIFNYFRTARLWNRLSPEDRSSLLLASTP